MVSMSNTQGERGKEGKHGKEAKLGFFDSGLGGLSIMKAVEEAMPEYVYTYFADSKNLPYGDKTEEEIFRFTKEGVAELFNDGAILVVLACNTASAETLRRLQDTYLLEEHPDKKILGVIIPTVEDMIERKLAKTLLVATRRTVASKKYELELAKLGANPANLTSVATPELVPLIEDRKLDEAFVILKPILEAHLKSGGDGLVLGCTHYTALKDHIRARYGNKLTVISQDEVIPEKLRQYLTKHTEIESRLMRSPYATKKDEKEIREHILK